MPSVISGIPFAPSLISTISRKSSKSSPDASAAEKPASSSNATFVASDFSKKLALATDFLPAVIKRQSSLNSNISTTSSEWSNAAFSPSRPPPERPADVLSGVLADDLRVRRSKCGADYLEEVAKGGPEAVEALNKDVGKKFKVVVGAEAVEIYKKFVGSRGEDPDKLAIDDEPVVFAVTVVLEAGRKVVDYYMTWKGKTRVKDIKDRRRSFLDKEFRSVAKSIDREYRRASVYGSSRASSAVYSESFTSFKENAEVEGPATSAPLEVKAPSPPPSLEIPPPDLKVDTRDSIVPPSATDSVMSLPYLNMIRGVPLGHRIPLRVTNPDNRLSMLSEISPIQEAPEVQTPQKAGIALPVVKEDDGENHQAEETENTPIPPPNPEPSKVPGITKARTASVRSAQSKDSTKSLAVSTSSSASVKSNKRKHSHRHSTTSTEFVIVLLDDKLEKTSRTWHGLERQVSTRNSVHSTPRRVSPWDGPLARDNGITYRTGPVRQLPTGDNENSSSEDEWENEPVVPRYSRGPFGPGTGAPVSEPATPLATKPVPMQLQHTPPGLMTPVIPTVGGMVTPVGSVIRLPYGARYSVVATPPLLPHRAQHPHPVAAGNNGPYMNSPYNPAYAASYHVHSPVAVLKPLTNSYMGYQSPYV